MSVSVGHPPVLAPRTAHPCSTPRGLFVLLCGMIAIGGILGLSSPAQAMPSSLVQQSTERVQTEPPPRAQDSSEQTSQEETTGPEQESSAELDSSVSEDEESFAENVIEGILVTLIFGPFIAILLGLLLAFPAVLLGVSLVMDGGCLRVISFGMGWLCALVCGGLVGAIIGEMILGLEVLVKPIFHVFIWGYPVVAYWGHKKLQAMPEEQYRAWEQTLTGGALLGFGAGSIAGLLRSAASGFGGFGGGTFGGGGASGSWSGASGAAGGASSGTAASTTASAAGGSSAEAAALATSAASGVASKASSSQASSGEVSSSAPADASRSRGLWTRLRQWFQKFQWYHGLVFALATLVFVPLGLGTMHALQNTKFFLFVLACVVVYSGHKLLSRHPDAARSVVDTVSSFQGGEASASWS